MFDKIPKFSCTSVENIQNHSRNPTVNFYKNPFDSKTDSILETRPGKTTHRRMSVRFDMNGEVLFAGRIVMNDCESNPTFIESSRSSAGIHEPLMFNWTDNKFVDPN